MKRLYMKFIKRFKVEILIGAILDLILSKFISVNILYIALVPSASMETTLIVGNGLLVTKDIDTLEVGEIYTFYHSNKLLIKRLIATGGDYVKIYNDDVYINDKKCMSLM